MKKVLIIWLIMISAFCKGQSPKLAFSKSNSYAVHVYLPFEEKPSIKIGFNKLHYKTQLTIGTYDIRLKYIWNGGDTIVNVTIDVQNDTVLNLDQFPGDRITLLGEVTIYDAGSVFSKETLKQVEGTAIYAGKKTEFITIANTKANLATNNGRQIYSKIAGLNIWESDAGGIQLGIGGRGLSPNRTSNFNTRQNGYDISADALGYPESYYSPVPDMVDRIEVVRGASSLQYGTQFGGLVNFRMKKAKQLGLHGSAKYTAGSFGFMNSTHQLSYASRKSGIYVAHQYKTGNGFRSYTGFDNHSLYANAFYSVKRRLTIGIDFTKMYYLAQQPGGLTDALFAKDPYTVLRKRNWFTVDWNLTAVYADFSITDKTKLNTRFFGLLAERKNVGFLGQINRPDVGQPREVLAGEFKNIGNETRLLTNYTWQKSMHTFLIGTRIYQGQTTALQGLAKTNDGPGFEFKDPNDIDYSSYLFPSRNMAAFTENIFRIGNKITITPGARFEYIETKSKGYYYQRYFDLSGDTLLELKNETSSQNPRTIFLGGIGVSYKPVKWMEFFGNFSQNYRAINFSDIAIVNPNFKVDKNISDEKGFTIDGGFRGNYKNWLSFDVSGFYLSYKDRIGEIFVQDEFSYTIVRYRTNIGDSYNYGLESFIETDFIKMINDSSKWSLSAFANYSFIRAYYSESENYAVSGNRVEFVPEQMLRAGLNVSYSGFFISYNYTYLGEQFSDATNAEKTSNAIYGLIPAYTVMDIGTGINFDHFNMEFHVNNLTNNSYFTRRATGYPGPGIIPAEARSFYFSFGVKF